VCTRFSARFFRYSNMHRVNAQATDVDHKSEEALQQILKPQFHGLIKDWMVAAGEGEKRGIIRFAEKAEPRLMQRIGRPQTEAQAARIMARPRQGFGQESFPPPRSPPGQTGFLYTMNTYGSMPILPGPPGCCPKASLNPAQDPEEIERIGKPGGYMVKMTDTMDVQRLKNKQRNKGTFELFGGSVEYMTTYKATNNLRNVGQQHLQQKIMGGRD
jgi:hypothetical protein